MCPPYGSTDQGGDQAVTLADRSGDNEPQVTLAIVATGGAQGAIALQVNHDGVNGALVTLRIQSHAANQFGAGLGTVLNQGGADGGADDAVEVHRGGVVN